MPHSLNEHEVLFMICLGCWTVGLLSLDLSHRKYCSVNLILVLPNNALSNSKWVPKYRSCNGWCLLLPSHLRNGQWHRRSANRKCHYILLAIGVETAVSLLGHYVHASQLEQVGLGPWSRLTMAILLWPLKKARAACGRFYAAVQDSWWGWPLEMVE